MLQRFLGDDLRLVLWHFAYNSGSAITVGAYGTPHALELAYQYWTAKLENGNLPLQVKDVDGNVFERCWYHLEIDDGEA